MFATWPVATGLRLATDDRGVGTQAVGEVIGPLVAVLVLAAVLIWLPLAALGIGAVRVVNLVRGAASPGPQR